MKTRHLKTSLALAFIGAGIVALPAHAVQINFTGGSNLDNLASVSGDDTIGDAWQTTNDGLGDSTFAMADTAATPQPFNPVNFSNGLGNFANALQFTINKSQSSAEGFQGLRLDGGPGLANFLTVMPDPADPSTWIDWHITYNLMDAASGLFQQILFTAPLGTELSQGVNFAANINIDGIFTNDSGWAASWDDRLFANVVPEPATLALFGMGLLGLAGARKGNLYKRS